MNATATTTKTHTLTLNNGAVHNLAQILGAPGFLTDPADLFRAGQILEESLIELPAIHDSVAGLDNFAATKVVRDWQRAGKIEIGMNERQRETAKKAVKAACEKGGMPPGPAAICLLAELGLAEGA